MKKVSSLFVAVILLLSLCACMQSAEERWREQYDLGVRYLSEGNYEEAIIAFTAAIEIDPKRAEGYIGRGNAYALSEETEDNLAAAISDYETALELDETLTDAWLGLADIYTRQEDYEMALEVLHSALDKIENNQNIADKIKEIEEKFFYNEYGGTNFEQRQGYREFETLTLEQQQVIIEMLTEAQNGDYVAMMETAQKNIDFAGAGNLTIWNGYKIEYDFPFSTDGKYDSHHCGITIRPQNGMGYKLTVEYFTDKEDGSYLCDINICSCLCVDWQWNGTLNQKEIYRYISKDPNCEQYSEQMTTGNITNGLRDGEFYITNYFLKDYEDDKHWKDHESTSESVDTYDMGVCILNSGIETGDDYITTWDGYISGTLQDQWTLDDIYW